VPAQINTSCKFSLCKKVFLAVAVSALMFLGIVLWRFISVKNNLSSVLVNFKGHSGESRGFSGAWRPKILDRNGTTLAVSVLRADVYAHPKRIPNLPEFVNSVSQLLLIPSEELEAKLDKNKSFVYLAQNVPVSLAKKAYNQVRDPLILDFTPKATRVYPFNEAASYLVGKVGKDNIGLFGIERQLDLMIKNGNKDKLRDLRLTIDIEVQRLVEAVFDKHLLRTGARSIFGVVMDGFTGEMLAIAQTERENLNLPISSVPSLKFVEYVFEPGSIFKTFSFAAILATKKYHLNSIVNCEGGTWKYGAHLIKDISKSHYLTVKDVFAKSSNIGTAKLSLSVDKGEFFNFLKNFGFGSKIWSWTEESKGIMFQTNIKPIDQIVASYGYGLAVTQIQLAQAFTTFLNDGVMISPRIFADSPVKTKRVLDSSISKVLKELLVFAVESEYGTGKAAKVDGLVVGGKTGTAKKIAPGGKGYLDGKYLSSFVGFAYMPNGSPLVIIVSVDEPNKKVYTGGAAAAPIFKEIVSDLVETRLYQKLNSKTLALNDKRNFN